MEPRHPANALVGAPMKLFTAHGPLFQYFGTSTTQLLDSIQVLRLSGYQLAMKNYGAVYGMLDAQQAWWRSLNTPVARIDTKPGSNRMKTF